MREHLKPGCNASDQTRDRTANLIGHQQAGRDADLLLFQGHFGRGAGEEADLVRPLSLRRQGAVNRQRVTGMAMSCST